MSKPKKQAKPQQNAPAAQAAPGQKENGKRNTILLAAGLALISFLVFIPALQNGFVWDDEFYILKNPFLPAFNLKQIFTEIVSGNYHPLTILTLAIEYLFFGLRPFGYHLVNLLIHAGNVVLVFIALRKLSGRNEVALVAALLSGIHPLHVESVAWASELKDVQYTFFFLSSYILYLDYVKQARQNLYWFSILCFAASLLSKAMAAPLPLVLLLTDYVMGRKMDRKALLDKVPYLLLAVVCGLVAIHAQHGAGADEATPFPFGQRIVFGAEAALRYILKLMVPLAQSGYYPYPIRPGEAMPASHYLYVLLFVAGVAAVVYSLRHTRKIAFGLGFFLLTVALVLQLLPVGEAMMADRYSYLPSVGLFYLAGEGFYVVYQGAYRQMAIITLSVLSLVYAAKTYARCAVWKDELTFWNDVIDQYQTVPIAYNNRGIVYKNQKNFTAALADLKKAVELKPRYGLAYNNLGVVYTELNQPAEALRCLDKAIEYKPDLADAYINRGDLLEKDRRPDEALKDYSRVIELNPSYTGAYYNRGTLYMNMKQYAAALADFNKAIALDPNALEGYYNRGILYLDMDKHEEAIADFKKAIGIKQDCLEAWFNMGVAYDAQHRTLEALDAYSNVIALEPGFAQAYYNRALSLFASGKKQDACADLEKAASLGFAVSDETHRMICQP